MRFPKDRDEGLQFFRVPLDLDPHHPCFVLDPTGQPAGPRGIVDEGAEPNPLDHAADCNREPAGRYWRAGRVGHGIEISEETHQMLKYGRSLQ